MLLVRVLLLPFDQAIGRGEVDRAFLEADEDSLQLHLVHKLVTRQEDIQAAVLDVLDDAIEFIWGAVVAQVHTVVEVAEPKHVVELVNELDALLCRFVFVVSKSQ